MQPEQALAYLDRLAAQAPMDRAGHQRALAAVATIRAALEAAKQPPQAPPE